MSPQGGSAPDREELDRGALAAVLADARAHADAQTSGLSQEQFSRTAPARDWALGPFAADPALTFRLEGQWPDPLDIGWTSSSLINPSLALDGDDLLIAYRASPVKESLSSRIGLARRRDGRWIDAGHPIVFPTLPAEDLGCEDPKLIRADGRWWLFYNGIFRLSADERAAHPSPGYPLESVGCDLLLAVSDDLEHWEKLGPIAPRSATRNWAKGAVIPRGADGSAVRIGGQYLMFVSEGFDGVLHLGRSDDLVNWVFEPAEYLDLTPLGGGQLHEVACATVVGDRIVLDLFFSAADGEWSAAQSLLALDDPTRQLDITRGGTLSWGGLLQLDGRWAFAQGWDAAPGERELYVYREVPGR